jgi:hypothetical protein
MTFALIVFWPGIKQEVERREWWELLWSCFGDATAAFWYLWFVVAYIGGFGTSKGGAVAGTISMLLGVAIDAGFSIWTFRSEAEAYRTATITRGGGQCTRHRDFGAIQHFEIVFRFLDAQGHEHAFWVIAVDKKASAGPTGYPPQLVAALRRGDKRFPAGIRYDPSHPQRAWVDGAGGVDENGYPWASLTLLGFQSMVLIILALKFLPELRAEGRHGHVPWWAEIFKVAPLAIEAICLAAFAILHLCLR